MYRAGFGEPGMEEFIRIGGVKVSDSSNFPLRQLESSNEKNDQLRPIIPFGCYLLFIAS